VVIAGQLIWILPKIDAEKTEIAKNLIGESMPENVLLTSQMLHRRCQEFDVVAQKDRWLKRIQHTKRRTRTSIAVSLK
jgi:hypothetical protein